MVTTRASIVVFFGLLLCLVAQNIDAFQFSVGDQATGWTVPSDPKSNIFNEWAERTRFQVGDSLVFAYQSNQDSVVYVNQEAYNTCNTDSYIAKYADGHTVFTFNQSGAFHFISGNKDHCLSNQKLVVVVLADRTSNKTSTPPSPSPSAPSPAPAGEQSPSPPAGTVDINPTPAPSSETSPPPAPNNAASLLVGFAASSAAVLASYVLLLN